MRGRKAFHLADRLPTPRLSAPNVDHLVVLRDVVILAIHPQRVLLSFVCRYRVGSPVEVDSELAIAIPLWYFIFFE